VWQFVQLNQLKDEFELDQILQHEDASFSASVAPGVSFYSF
jgi:hypothetical protein